MALLNLKRGNVLPTKINSLTKDARIGLFTDRDIPRSAFLKSCIAFKNDQENTGRRAIAWSGAGGIGKTELLDFLKNAVETEKKLFFAEFEIYTLRFRKEKQRPDNCSQNFEKYACRKIRGGFSAI